MNDKWRESPEWAASGEATGLLIACLYGKYWIEAGAHHQQQQSALRPKSSEGQQLASMVNDEWESGVEGVMNSLSH
jgi:hypothetical protein